ncbi:MAG: glycosyltransferase family 2 protein [Bacteroidales bacterium]|nr:glycosyltransferase family 2 protein [Clostridium sp.]MCM1202936.1 glycosyltransferase family 2 protein [Bacteroidales bacterium]
MEKLLTVIVPTYNVEQYIAQNLNSFAVPEVLEQLEVIVVSDGSTDNSVSIAGDFVKQYPSAYRIVEKENGGHGSAINRGIREAKGKYLKVVDADDWVLRDGLLRLMECLGQTDSDIVVSNFYWYHHGTGKTSVEIKEPFAGVEYGKEYAFDKICREMYIKMHALTIKTEILKKIPAIDEHCFYVDAEYVLFPVPYIRTVTCIEDFVYMYRIGLPGQSMDISKMQKNEENFDRVLKRLLDYYQEWIKQGLSKNRLSYMEQFLGRLVASRFKIFLSYPFDWEIQKKMRAFNRRIREDYPEIYRVIRNRAVKLLQYSDFRLYWLAQYTYKKKEGIK